MIFEELNDATRYQSFVFIFFCALGNLQQLCGVGAVLPFGETAIGFSAERRIAAGRQFLELRPRAAAADTGIELQVGDDGAREL